MTARMAQYDRSSTLIIASDASPHQQLAAAVLLRALLDMRINSGEMVCGRHTRWTEQTRALVRDTPRWLAEDSQPWLDLMLRNAPPELDERARARVLKMVNDGPRLEERR